MKYKHFVYVFLKQLHVWHLTFDFCIDIGHKDCLLITYIVIIDITDNELDMFINSDKQSHLLKNKYL